MPEDGEIFECPPGEKISFLVRDRLNDYSLVAGIEFVISRVRKGLSFKVLCKHFGKHTANKRHLKDKVVRKGEEGQILTDRQRNCDDGRTGCRVRYMVNYSLKDDAKGSEDRHWIGHWAHDPEDHFGHPFPCNPMKYLPLKRRLNEY